MIITSSGMLSHLVAGQCALVIVRRDAQQCTNPQVNQGVALASLVYTQLQFVLCTLKHLPTTLGLAPANVCRTIKREQSRSGPSEHVAWLTMECM